MKRTFLYLLIIISFASLSCEKVLQDTTTNQKYINTDENSDDRVLVKRIKEIEHLNNPYQTGQKDAQADAGNEKFYIKISGGDPTKEVLEWKKDLKEKYGIQVQILGCCYSDKVDKYTEGYNSISKPQIKKRFGRYVLDDSRKEVLND